jgi:hypothetical protein
VTLLVPAGVNGNFTALGTSGNVSYDFGFLPKVTVNYQFSDLGFGVGASGELTNLLGKLTRTIDSPAGSANLTVDAHVNFAVANVVEGTLPLPLNRFCCCQDTCLQDTVLLGTLAARYAHLDQTYTATLSSGANSSTLTANQTWDGYGISTSLSVLHPLPRNFFLYGVARGSFLLGTNDRNSNLSVVVAGSSASTSTKLTENKTEFLPIGEFEVGVAWGKALFATQVPGAATGKAGPLLWVKAGLIADIWGELGFLSAIDQAQGFSDGRLFLYGFSVMAGIQF